MNLLSTFFNSASNTIQNAIGINRTVEELIRDRDISKVISLLQNRDEEVNEAILEYNPDTHKIMRKQDKIRIGRPPKVLAKLSAPYQQIINEIELTFMYGNPPTWQQDSDGADRAFQVYSDVLKNTRWNTTQREFKRLAGAETEAAKLYYVYKNDAGEKKVGVKVLAKSKGDELRPLFDQYDNMLSFGHGYYLLEGVKTVYHFDIYYPTIIYRCKKTNGAWEVIAEKNDIGKIPVIYVTQNKAWYGIQPLIDRIEALRSRVSDVNDYVADPILVMSADVAESLKSKKDTAGLPDTEKAGGGKVVGVPSKDSKFDYLSVDTAVDLKREEIKDLEKCIYMLSMTPDLSFDALVAAGAPTGRALKRAMALGYMKRAKNMEIYYIAHEREASIIKAIIGNVLDVSLKSEVENLSVSCQLAEPFQDDVSEKIADIINLYSSELISRETALTLIDYINDPSVELDKILTELKERREQQIETQGSLLGEFQRAPKNEEEEE
jgi:SPP1 family phage portal protein